MKKFFFVLLSLLFGCNDERPHITNMINKSSKLGKKYGLYCFGSGIYGPEKVQAYALTFETETPYTIAQLRSLLVRFVEDYIKLANTMPDVLSDIENPPFSEMHGAIRIMVPEQECMGKRFCGIQLQKGKVAFLYRDKEKGLKDLFYESYSESYFKVFQCEPPQRL